MTYKDTHDDAKTLVTSIGPAIVASIKVLLGCRYTSWIARRQHQLGQQTT